MYSKNDYRYYELYHHGILGQKWYLRRFQNPDGSLTTEGKKRYGKGDTNGVEGVKFKKVRGTMYADSPEIKRAGDDLKRRTTSITNQVNELSNQYTKENDRLRNDKAFVSKMANKMKTDFGLEKGDIDNLDVLLSFADDVVYDNIDRYYSKDLKDKEAALQKSFDDYYDSAKSYVNNIVKDKGDVKIDGNNTYRNVVSNTLNTEAQTQWVNYLRNHQEDISMDCDVTYSDVAEAVMNKFLND